MGQEEKSTEHPELLVPKGMAGLWRARWKAEEAAAFIHNRLGMDSLHTFFRALLS